MSQSAGLGGQNSKGRLFSFVLRQFSQEPFIQYMIYAGGSKQRIFMRNREFAIKNNIAYSVKHIKELNYGKNIKLFNNFYLTLGRNCVSWNEIQKSQ